MTLFIPLKGNRFFEVINHLSLQGEKEKQRRKETSMKQLATDSVFHNLFSTGRGYNP
jgi:hypothetical protein